MPARAGGVSTAIRAPRKASGPLFRNGVGCDDLAFGAVETTRARRPRPHTGPILRWYAMCSIGTHMSARRCLALLPLLVAFACARPPVPLRGDFAEVSVPEAVANSDAGGEVRWGGEVVETTPMGDRTCFEVVERPLDRAARPRATDETDGRFIACTPGFHDPALWEPGREMTVVGTLAGTETGTIGEAAYRFPRVEAQAVHLWPVRDPSARTRPAFSIGVGGGSGGWGSGVGGGIGIGF